MRAVAQPRPSRRPRSAACPGRRAAALNAVRRSGRTAASPSAPRRRPAPRHRRRVRSDGANSASGWRRPAPAPPVASGRRSPSVTMKSTGLRRIAASDHRHQRRDARRQPGASSVATDESSCRRPPVSRSRSVGQHRDQLLGRRRHQIEHQHQGQQPHQARRPRAAASAAAGRPAPPAPASSHSAALVRRRHRAVATASALRPAGIGSAARSLIVLRSPQRSGVRAGPSPSWSEAVVRGQPLGRVPGLASRTSTAPLRRSIEVSGHRAHPIAVSHDARRAGPAAARRGRAEARAAAAAAAAAGSDAAAPPPAWPPPPPPPPPAGRGSAAGPRPVSAGRAETAAGTSEASSAAASPTACPEPPVAAGPPPCPRR